MDRHLKSSNPAPAQTDQVRGWRMRVADYLGLEHNVTIASAAVFLIGFGEELWKKFIPKYLEALGATAPIIGLFGTAEDFFRRLLSVSGRLYRCSFWTTASVPDLHATRRLRLFLLFFN